VTIPKLPVHDAAAELRTFVHSVMPAALVERGLCESGLGEAVVKRLRRRTRPGY
jgi:hypothetical protein